MAARPKSAEDKNFSQRMREGLFEVHGYPLLKPYTELIMNTWIEVSADELDKKITLNENVMKFIPVGTAVYRRASLLAQADRQEEARVQIERSIWSYPGDFPAYRKDLSVLLAAPSPVTCPATAGAELWGFNLTSGKRARIPSRTAKKSHGCGFCAYPSNESSNA